MWTDMSERLRDGIVAVHARDFDTARGHLQQATTDLPDSARAWFWLSLAARTGAEAMGCLRRAIALDASYTQARDALARLLLAQANALATTDRLRARGFASEATTIAPHLDSVWVALAALIDVPAERLHALRRAAAIAPHRPELRGPLHDALIHEGVVLAKAGKRAEAAQLFREAAELDPQDARVWQALVRVADSHEETIAGLRGLLKAAPDHPGARTALKDTLKAHASALAGAGQTADALKCWREAAELDENDRDVWLGLAASTTDAAEIRRAVERAYRIDPRSQRAATWLAKLRAGDRPAANRPAAPAAAPASTSAPAKQTVMVVDDSPTIRKILGLTLERAGYAVVAEADGEQAMARLAQLTPDLILLDITMPKLDGYEVCKRIKKNPRTARIPVVMLSGKDGFFDKVKGRMVGATEYLTKPFEAPAVLKVIASHCQRSSEAAHG